MLLNRIIDILGEIPEGPALISRDRTIDFQELRDIIVSAALHLDKSGVNRGSHVAILLPDGMEYCICYAAVWLLGAVAVPLHVSMKPDTVAGLLSHSDTEFLVLSDKYPSSPAQLRQKVQTIKWVAGGKGADSDLAFLSETVTGSFEFPDIDETEPCGIFYTSGTTGNPKGIVWNYRHLDAPLQIMEHFLGMPGDDTMICAAPLGHAGGLVYFLGCLKWHTPVVMMERFIPGSFIRNVDKHKVTCCFLVPAMIAAIVRSPEFRSADLSSLRWMASFGAVADLQSLEKLREKCPDLLIFNGWGMMESAPPNTLPKLEGADIDPSGVGYPAPWIDIRIVDDAGNELPGGEIGEVVLKGWVVMDGYYREPELTAEIVRDGWLHSGDLGRLDDRGYLYIVGRKKNVIIVGGLNVQASEVERMLESLPGIEEAAVTSVPHDLKGEAVKAFVIKNRDSRIDEKDVIEFCRTRLESHKIPVEVMFVRELPRTTTGKVAKWRLK